MSVNLLIDYSSKSHYNLVETKYKYRYNASKINILTITAKIFTYEIYCQCPRKVFSHKRTRWISALMCIAYDDLKT